MMRVCSTAVASAILVTSSLSLLSARPSAAQQIAPGIRIRSQISPSARWRTGTLVRFGRDSLVMQRCRECAPEAQPWSRITRVDVREGTTWSGRHMALGALGGGVIAAAIETQRVRRDMARCHDGPCGLAVLGIPIVGLLGAAGGAVLGALWRVDSWREIYCADPAR